MIHKIKKLSLSEYFICSLLAVIRMSNYVFLFVVCKEGESIFFLNTQKLAIKMDLKIKMNSVNVVIE